ncbi:hypothetical protein [Streptomyces alboniger]|uniref:Uncharacterized protein n=1 Tax=Streptomyces alboniger TaxID=132473 RepID=A0A5J6HQT4_STRAD|nr:hypothetical protein [Streptomyces alboniger]QEV20803.1 hypothetical protein CP975_27565 [Streptomyces alboniger]
MRHRRALTATLLGILILALAAVAVPASAAQRAVANPSPLPLPESLITEGVTVEGPLINNVGIPHLL